MNEHYRETTRAILQCFEDYGLSLTIEKINRIVFYNLGILDKILDLILWLEDESYIEKGDYGHLEPYSWIITEKGEEFLSNL